MLSNNASISRWYTPYKTSLDLHTDKKTSDSPDAAEVVVAGAPTEVRAFTGPQVEEFVELFIDETDIFLLHIEIGANW